MVIEMAALKDHAHSQPTLKPLPLLIFSQPLGRHVPCPLHRCSSPSPATVRVNTHFSPPCS